MCGPQFSMHFSLNFNSATVMEKNCPTEGEKEEKPHFPMKLSAALKIYQFHRNVLETT